MSGFLTKVELAKLYGICGEKLHRGRVGRLSGNSSPDLQQPREWADKIWTLLEHHRIETVYPTVRIIGLMKDKEESRPQFSYWVRRANGLWAFDGAVRA